MKMLAGFMLSTLFLLSVAGGLAAAPLLPASCALSACATQFIDRVAHKHRHKQRIFPPVQADQCPLGEMPDSDGNCLPVARKRSKTQQQVFPAVEQCPEGQNFNPNTGNCFSCSHNDHFENGRCVPCQQGFHVSGDSCVAD